MVCEESPALSVERHDTKLPLPALFRPAWKAVRKILLDVSDTLKYFASAISLPLIVNCFKDLREPDALIQRHIDADLRQRVRDSRRRVYLDGHPLSPC